MAIVCDGPTFGACLAGWERPTDDGTPREFEALWTVERHLVRVAAAACVDLTRRITPKLADRAASALDHVVPNVSDDARHATTITNRLIAYIEGWDSAGG